MPLLPARQRDLAVPVSLGYALLLAFSKLFLLGALLMTVINGPMWLLEAGYGPDSCRVPFEQMELDIRGGLEPDATLLSIAMVNAENGRTYIGGLVTSPEIDGTGVAVWATNRSYDPDFWGPRDIGDIVPVNPVAMTVSQQHYQPWVSPEWAQSASRRIGKEPTLISLVSMEDRGAQRAVQCVIRETSPAGQAPHPVMTLFVPPGATARPQERGVD